MAVIQWTDPVYHLLKIVEKKLLEIKKTNNNDTK